MDLTIVFGLIIGFGALVLGFVLEGGHVTALVALSPAVIVFGGTLGATIIAFSLQEVLTVPQLLRIAFVEVKYDVMGTINLLASLADKARREGLLSLEQEITDINDRFMQQGVQLIVDGTDPELTRNMMETEIYAVEERHKTGIGIFEAAGGYAPTMGIIGTVMGLVHVLSNLSEPEKLGPSIAMAFIATLYGVASANLAWLPIAGKLKNKSKKERLVRELVMEGILSIQAGENPTIIREKLMAFLNNQEKGKTETARTTQGMGLEV